MGSDSSAHLSEDMQNASYSFRRSMLCTALMYYTTSILTTIMLMFCLAESAEQLVGTSFGQPYIYVCVSGCRSHVYDRTYNS